ncbi:unnamed protein product [Rhodiola kirilowii]
MKALSWNCRGMGHPRTVRELAEMARIHRPDVIGLQETKIDVSRMEGIQKQLGFRCGFHVPRCGLAGGLALWWKENVDLTILSYSRHHIDARIDGEETFRITLIYGDPVTGKRAQVWDLIRRLSGLWRLPWLVFGDFNEICFSWEVKGGRVRGEWQMRAFRETLMDCGLADLGFVGNPFTFSNKRSGRQETRARLDRMLANADWRRAFPNTQVSHISTTSSDHVMLLINCNVRVRHAFAKHFKFEPMWVRNEEFEEVVKAEWQKDRRCEMGLKDRLKCCSEAFAVWNKEKFGKVRRRINELREELEMIRMQDRDREVIEREEVLIARIDEWRFREEILWRQRSRAEWLREGDRNTSYFHAKATRRKEINTITRLQNRDGVWVSDDNQIANLIKEYFTEIFSSSIKHSEREYFRHFSSVTRKITADMASKLCEPVTPMEVQAAIFQMSPTKAPGPDGFHAMFYQKYWHIVKESVVAEVLGVFRRGRMEEGMNETTIVLVPKNKKPKRLEEFRPISLCNVSAKIVMKILSNRLKEILPKIVSEAQGAFVPGRLISDNILLAHEVLHFIKSRKNQRVGFFSIKTDMSKAYDRMEWSFLEKMLVHLGFPDSWIRLVLECIRSVRYKVKFNDLLIDLPAPERGLRQGDPLSPYLFLLCSEWLSERIGTEISSNSLKGVRICQGAPIVSHLFFADDSIFFMKATEANARGLKTVLDEYEALSGQRINFDKSEMVFSRNVPALLRKQIRDIFGVREVGVHSKYLGLPLVFSHNKTEAFKYIVNNTWKRVVGWREAHLSAAGKEVMVKSVLQALPTYAMMCYKLPVAVCMRIARIIRKFWWTIDGDNRGIHWANPFKLSLPKEEGGLSFRDLSMFNDALLAKQFWRLLDNPNTQFSRTIKAKYFKHTDLLVSQLKGNSSMAWRGIWKAGMKVREWISWDMERDRPVWVLEKDGIFSTRSAYSKLREELLKSVRAEKGESSDRSKFTSFWNKVWKLKLQGKVKLFIWRLFHDYLPTAGNLVRRGCKVDLDCKICGFEYETSMHTFIDCWWARAFWKKLNIDCDFLDMKLSSTSDWVWYCFQTRNTEELLLFCYGARMIWYNRNMTFHAKECLNLDDMCLSTKALVKNYIRPSFLFTTSDLEGACEWRAPSKPFLKINCDGAWCGFSGRAGISGICRDDEGFVSGVLAESIEHIRSPFEAEGMAVLKAMYWALERGLSHCIFEVDCAQVFSSITLRSHSFSKLHRWAQECLLLLQSKENWRISVIRREANRQADALAKMARELNWSWRSFVAVP